MKNKYGRDKDPKTKTQRHRYKAHINDKIHIDRGTDTEKCKFQRDIWKTNESTQTHTDT